MANVPSGGKKGKKAGKHQKHVLYENRGMRERHKKEGKARMEKHLLLAKARRARNHPEKASEKDFKALEKLNKG